MIKAFFRRFLRGLCILLLRVRSRPLEITATTGPVLVLAPHQDDEALGCGGLISVLAELQVPVAVAFLTDGSASHPDHPILVPAALRLQRADEARAAGAELGLQPAAIHFLNAPDSRLPDLNPAEAADFEHRLRRLLDEFKPRLILMPYRHDGSSEHEAAFVRVLRVLASGPECPRVLEFPVWAWWSPRLLTGALLRTRRVFRVRFREGCGRKARALAAYRSQVAPVPPWKESVLSPSFVSAFLTTEEYFFES